MLKIASLTLSVVGLVFMPGTALSARPFASPAITLIVVRSSCCLRRVAAKMAFLSYHNRGAR